MKEETLKKIKEEIIKKQEEIKKEKARIKRIKKLETTKLVLEYLELTETPFYEEEEIIDDDYVMHTFNKRISDIKENETNKIFVYLGSYKRNYGCIEHGSSDSSSYQVPYSSEEVDYRLYRDLEQFFPVEIEIKDCDEFESKHNIIDVGYFNATSRYYTIREQFIYEAIKNGQHSAKQKVLTHNKLLDKKM